MTDLRQVTLDEWEARYPVLKEKGLTEPSYGGPLGRHVACGDLRLPRLKYDDSPAALRLWNFLLSEEDRLREARRNGCVLVGAMKDLGTVPVMAYSLPNVRAFYPDGAWWIPCIMQHSAGLLDAADALGFDESFCPVRAMLGAFVTGNHFPIPDMLTCSAGAVCDDFSVIAQRLESMGHEIAWWEIPRRRAPEAGEAAVDLPGGARAPRDQVELAVSELQRVRNAIEACAGRRLSDDDLAQGIETGNGIRRLLARLRQLVFTAGRAPLPSLEMLIAEMLAIHFCSDPDECRIVLEGLVQTVEQRVRDGAGFFGRDAVRVFWVNPVADIRVMNLLEECGGRICGTDYLFTHALDEIPADTPPMEALARSALADPMVGSTRERAVRVCEDMRSFGAEAVVISRIPGASHCALEGGIIADEVEQRLGLPSVEIEVPPVSDSVSATLRSRLEALVETVIPRGIRGGRAGC